MLWIHLKTIFSFRFYHLLTFTSRKQRVWFGIYLGLLCTLVFYLFATTYIQRNLPVFLKDFPVVTFEKGFLTAPDKPVSAPIPNSDFQISFDSTRKTPPTVNEMMQTNTLMLISGNTLYMPGSTGLQKQTFPTSMSFSTTPEFLQQYKSILMATLRMMAFAAALFFIPLILVFDFCLASTVGLFFNLFRPLHVKRTRVLTWAFFMLGPLSALWLVRLWVNIPLFTLAQIIVCIIYMQQIFNTLPEEN